MFTIYTKKEILHFESLKALSQYAYDLALAIAPHSSNQNYSIRKTLALYANRAESFGGLSVDEKALLNQVFIWNLAFNQHNEQFIHFRKIIIEDSLEGSKQSLTFQSLIKKVEAITYKDRVSVDDTTDYSLLQSVRSTIRWGIANCGEYTRFLFLLLKNVTKR